MAADEKKIAELLKRDLYAVFGLTSDVEEKAIRSAYRKKAKKYHPDKNRDNSEAAERFQELTDALLILADPRTRATYDKLLKAKQGKAIRDQELDAKRRKDRDDLEARERAARERTHAAANHERQLQAEIARLREEGARIIEEESRLMREQLAKSSSRVQQEVMDASDCKRIKIRWKAEDRNYTQEELKRFLEKHGRIDALIIPSRKLGRAMVDFRDVKAARSAVKYVKGFPGAPLSLRLVDGSERPAGHEHATPLPPTQEGPSSPKRSAQDDLAFEQMVYAKMRAHAEKQRARSVLGHSSPSQVVMRQRELVDVQDGSSSIN